MGFGIFSPAGEGNEHDTNKDVQAAADAAQKGDAKAAVGWLQKVDRNVEKWKNNPRNAKAVERVNQTRREERAARSHLRKGK